MCLGIPARVLSKVVVDDPLLSHGTVELLGARRDVSFAFVSDVEVGDFVLVHVGVAIAKLEASEAARIDALLDADLDAPRDVTPDEETP
jgi:hydrogenase expression/formation protein HypC